MKKWFFTVVPTVIGVFLLIYLIYYIGIPDIIKLFSNISWIYVIPYLFVSFFIFLGFVLRWKIIIDTYGFKTKFKDLFFYKTSTFAINFITPGARLAGEPVRASFLHQDGLEMPKSASSVVMDKTIEMAADVILTLIGIIILMFHFTLKKSTGIIIIGDLLLLLVILVWFFYRIHRGKGFFSIIITKTPLRKIEYLSTRISKVRESERHMHRFMTEHAMTFWLTFILSITLWLMSIFEFKFLALMFGVDLSYTALFAVLVAVGFAILLPIPAGIGALEFTQVFLLKVVGEKGNLGIGLGFVTRIRDLIWVAIGMGYMYKRGIDIKEKIKEKPEKIV